MEQDKVYFTEPIAFNMEQEELGEAFQSLKEQLNRIESYIERSTTLSKEIDDNQI